jgi:hypothetical protein
MTHPGGLAAGAVVVLSGDMLHTALNAGLLAAHNRQRNGLPAGEYVALALACQSAIGATCIPHNAEPPTVDMRVHQPSRWLMPLRSDTARRTASVAASGHPEPAAAQHWLSTRQTAQQLGCSDRTARRIAQKVGHRIGREWLIPAAALPEEE